MRHSTVSIEGINRSGVLVLGMHRSGTSALTRVLNLLGCDVPTNLIGANRSNEAGHWESNAIARLNDEILASGGSEWCDWLPFNPGWLNSPRAGEFKEKALAVLEQEYGDSRLFVLKDPRICRIADFWLDVLRSANVRPALVMPQRNPTEVAESLARRNSIDPALGYLLWLRHTLDAEASTRGTKRFHTSFDSLLSCWPRQIESLQSTLDLQLPRLSPSASEEIDASLREHLRHHRVPTRDVLENPLISSWVRDAYGVFSRWAEDGEAEADHATLDQVRAELNAAAPAFARMVSLGRNSTLRAIKLEKQVTELETKLTEGDTAQKAQAERVKGLETQLANKLAEVNAGQAAQAQQAERVTALESQLAELRETIERSDTDLASARSDLSLREAEASKAAAEVEALQDRLKQAEQEHAAGLSALEEAAQQRLTEAGAEYAALAAEYASLQGDHASLQTEAESLREVLDEQNAALSFTQSALAQRSAEADQTAAELAELKRTLAEAEQAHEAECAALKRAVDEAERAHAHALAELEESAATQFKDAEARLLQDLDRERAKSISQLDEIIILSKNLRDREEDHASLLAEKAQLDRQVEVLEQALRDAQHQATVFVERISDADRRTADANEALRRQAVQNEELAGEIERERAIAYVDKADSEQARLQLERQAAWLRMLTEQLLRPRSWNDRLLALLPERMRGNSANRRLLDGQGLFDCDAYLALHPDVAAAGADPLRHFIEHGLQEGRQLPGQQLKDSARGD